VERQLLYDLRGQLCAAPGQQPAAGRASVRALRLGRWIEDARLVLMVAIAPGADTGREDFF
jgi:hypothetical protein